VQEQGFETFLDHGLVSWWVWDKDTGNG